MENPKQTFRIEIEAGDLRLISDALFAAVHEQERKYGAQWGHEIINLSGTGERQRELAIAFWEAHQAIIQNAEGRP